MEDRKRKSAHEEVPADWHARCQFTGDLGTSPTRQLLGAYITGENDGRACAGIAATAEMLSSATPTEQSGNTNAWERADCLAVATARGSKGPGITHAGMLARIYVTFIPSRAGASPQLDPEVPWGTPIDEVTMPLFLQPGRRAETVMSARPISRALSSLPPGPFLRAP